MKHLLLIAGLTLLFSTAEAATCPPAFKIHNGPCVLGFDKTTCALSSAGMCTTGNYLVSCWCEPKTAAGCTSTKAKAAGKKASGLLKAFGKNLKKPDTAKLGQSISKAQSKFTKAFSKAEAKGGCFTTGDSGAIEAKVDAFVNDAVSEVDPPSTTTTTGGATTTTTGAATTTTTGGATTTTSTTTSTTSTTIVGQPPCGGAAAPLCDGHCPPLMMCVDLGGFCDCVPTGGPCGAVAPPPLCYGDCPPLMACVDMGGSCMCMP